MSDTAGKVMDSIPLIKLSCTGHPSLIADINIGRGLFIGAREVLDPLKNGLGPLQHAVLFERECTIHDWSQSPTSSTDSYNILLTQIIVEILEHIQQLTIGAAAIGSGMSRNTQQLLDNLNDYMVHGVSQRTMAQDFSRNPDRGLTMHGALQQRLNDIR